MCVYVYIYIYIYIYICIYIYIYIYRCIDVGSAAQRSAARDRAAPGAEAARFEIGYTQVIYIYIYIYHGCTNLPEAIPTRTHKTQ